MMLHEAVEAGDPVAVRQAVEAGADVNGSFSECDECPLSVAAATGQPELVRLLLELGADPNNRRSITPPLCAAAVSGSPDTIAALIEAGAEVDTRDEDGSTPLMLAAAYGDRAAVEKLLESRANPKLEDESGKTALASAVEKNHTRLCEVLMPLSTSQERQKAQIQLEIYAQGGADERISSLILAATRGNDKEVHAIVESGVAADAINEQGKTALMRAANKNHMEIVRWLLECGADINRKDIYGNYPLLYAAMGCHPEMYDFLYPLTEKKLRKQAEKMRQNQIDIGNWPAERE
ncbi:Ankyrin repeats (3 copies) [Posidoniimonas polymericola]|uniref:Ankyrin repeats (3 copies) n=2 Tax=Posidoniimonas polymericola TaxID=2528002 RepID=A0A5C5YM33_9BACT|nr:ankyrin repeat domain-containing protein [Posidoniimonas polymericola]TWT75867.1 Ankyrin repeats (3 copies) [Posidoniimonas polymericola]